DANGQLLSEEVDNSPNGASSLFRIAKTPDGGFVMAGYKGDVDNAYVEKRDASGALEWSQTVASNIFITAADYVPGSGFFFSGRYIPNTNTHMGVLKLDENGAAMWTSSVPINTLGSTQHGYYGTYYNRVSGSEVDGGCFFTFVGNNSTAISKLNPSGQYQWSKTFPNAVFQTRWLFGIDGTSDGGCIAAGFFQGDVSPYYPYLVKLDAEGNLYPNSISGQIYFDQNKDCAFNGQDFNVNRPYIVKAENATNSFYGSTDPNGHYEIELPDGDYVLSAHAPIPYSEFCDNYLPIAILGPNDHQVVDFADSIEACPLLEVNINSTALRPCFISNYYVSVCNNGYATATGAYVEVLLDDWMSYESSTIPASQNGQLLSFQLGDLLPGECTFFYIWTILDCNTPLGLTHCTEAHAYPDEWCGPIAAAWDGSNVEVTAECVDNETIRFRLQNTGTGDMQQPSQLIVIEDHMVMLSEPFQLPSGNEQLLDFPATGGTFRLQTEQSPGHPGFSHPAAVVEACGLGNVANISTGFVNMFPMDDADPWIDVDCRENSLSYDPNLKEAFPIGYMEDHRIGRNTDLEYLLRFQNTGTDTAFQVVLIDTLSPSLDPTTIRPSVSSHPYEFELTGSGIAKFTFPDILLPDSNVNEPLSHGFVKFRIAQRPNLPWGTVIHNSAAIYFDFNAPVITNTTTHLVDTNFIEISDIITLPENLGRLLVYPNPAASDVVFELTEASTSQATIRLFDALGRTVLERDFKGRWFILYRNWLHPGVFFYEVEMDGKRSYSGKLVVH
ncbi:MAG: T9SS type A sorting domain-containing protein, partial [Saprospiraceae bacterium]|nr:T9SS type A sorting domain-containing protein [Saprospiraceae bacterium]